MLGEPNVCFEFLLICAALALNIPVKRSTERGRGVKYAPRVASLSVNNCHVLPSLIIESCFAFPLPYTTAVCILTGKNWCRVVLHSQSYARKRYCFARTQHTSYSIVGRYFRVW